MTGCCCPGNCRRDYGLNKSFKIEYILEAFFRTGFQAPRSVDQTNFLTFFFFFTYLQKTGWCGMLEPNGEARGPCAVRAQARWPAVEEESGLEWGGVGHRAGSERQCL